MIIGVLRVQREGQKQKQIRIHTEADPDKDGQTEQEFHTSKMWNQYIVQYTKCIYKLKNRRKSKSIWTSR